MGNPDVSDSEEGDFVVLTEEELDKATNLARKCGGGSIECVFED